MSKIRILVVPPDTYAVGKFRMTNPYTHLQENYPEDFHIDLQTNIPDDDRFFENYDIVVAHSFIHNNVPFERNIERIDWLKNKGVIVVIDADDYWEPDFRHPLRVNVIQGEIHKKKIQLLQSASYVTTTTSVFRDTMMKKLHVKNVIVLPNAIDETESQFIPRPIKSDKIRFGWLGGSSHGYDLELMRSGICDTIDYGKDKVQMVLCGFDLRGEIKMFDKSTGKVTTRPMTPEENVWTQYESVFTNYYKSVDPDYLKHLKLYKQDIPYNDIDKPYRRRWTMDITKYATNYNTFDVSLAPIVDSEFNNNKSQLKAIEAGFHKKALIASETPPYTIDLVNAFDKGGGFNPKGNALLVSQRKNHKQWGQYMKKLIDNPNLIEDLSGKLHETMYPKYSLNKVNKDRSEFLKSIINKQIQNNYALLSNYRV